METRLLGRTGLRVTAMGLGCGGPSRIGLSAGITENESVAIVRRALDRGVTIIDTAEGYQTERFVGEAVAQHGRDTVVISTKVGTWDLRAEQIAQRCEQSLRMLRTDHIDVYHLHAVAPLEYERLRESAVPELLKLREQGKIRFLGITERFESDTGHAMLWQALAHDWFDVVMVGYNMLNQSARGRVFTMTQRKNIGVLNMFAVRRALSRPEILAETVTILKKNGQLPQSFSDAGQELEEIAREAGAAGVVDLAYRFCRQESGIHVVLVGTGSINHLEENFASFEKPLLGQQIVERLRALFSRVDSVSGS